MMEYLDRLPAGWFILDVMRTEGRAWDWVALVIDVNPDDINPDDHKTWGHREGLVRVPGKHRKRGIAWEALENMIATRH